jgi:N-hydroxyarylamine O-acetyltransferase
MGSTQLTAFFERVHYQGSTEPTLETLKQLQRAFLLAVPFENLDMLFEEHRELSFSAFYEKIVVEQRGGNSYECNGLFYSILKALGFDVALLSAQMVTGEQLSPEFDHMMLRVSLDKDYLVDVSNVQLCPEPLLLDIDKACEYHAERSSFKLALYQGQPALFFKTPSVDWQPRLVINIAPCALTDFAAMFRFHQSSNDSILRQGQLVTMMTQTGRLTLSGMTLITINNDRADTDRVVQQELTNQAEYLARLKACFGIEFED